MLHLLMSGVNHSELPVVVLATVTTLHDSHGKKPSTSSWSAAYVSAPESHFGWIEAKLANFNDLPRTLTYRADYRLRHLQLPVVLRPFESLMPRTSDGAVSFCGISCYGQDDAAQKQVVGKEFFSLAKLYAESLVFKPGTDINSRVFK